jgi:hypothetical protein
VVNLTLFPNNLAMPNAVNTANLDLIVTKFGTTIEILETRFLLVGDSHYEYPVEPEG